MGLGPGPLSGGRMGPVFVMDMDDILGGGRDDGWRWGKRR